MFGCLTQRASRGRLGLVAARVVPAAVEAGARVRSAPGCPEHHGHAALRAERRGSGPVGADRGIFWLPTGRLLGPGSAPYCRRDGTCEFCRAVRPLGLNVLQGKARRLEGAVNELVPLSPTRALVACVVQFQGEHRSHRLRPAKQEVHAPARDPIVRRLPPATAHHVEHFGKARLGADDIAFAHSLAQDEEERKLGRREEDVAQAVRKRGRLITLARKEPQYGSKAASPSRAHAPEVS